MYARSMILPDLRDRSKLDATSPTLLEDLGFIHKGGAGRFSLLPLGTLVLERMKNVHRKHMLAVGAVETTFLTLAPSETWRRSGRWDNFGPALIKTRLNSGAESCLTPTHEEAAVAIMADWLKSYRDLPINLFCTQKVYRDEPRPKSQLLRTHEFIMADSYSFHADPEDADACYKTMQAAFARSFEAYGLPCTVIHADNGLIGGSRSVEFQFAHSLGESQFVSCDCGYSGDADLLNEARACPECKASTVPISGIEVGHIFHLETTYSESMGLRVRAKDNHMIAPLMTCTGIGMTRSLQAAVLHHLTVTGIAWPADIAPYDIIISPKADADIEVRTLEATLVEKGLSVLVDDRAAPKAAKSALKALLNPPLHLSQNLGEWIVSLSNGRRVDVSAPLDFVREKVTPQSISLIV
jgi:prolyl-tRNA synthetase